MWTRGPARSLSTASSADALSHTTASQSVKLCASNASMQRCSVAAELKATTITWTRGAVVSAKAGIDRVTPGPWRPAGGPLQLGGVEARIGRALGGQGIVGGGDPLQRWTATG
jgi:hypothetical protein